MDEYLITLEKDNEERTRNLCLDEANSQHASDRAYMFFSHISKHFMYVQTVDRSWFNGNLFYNTVELSCILMLP